MSQREQTQTPFKADKWALAALFKAHPMSVHSWQKHGGLGGALISPGGPGKPALFDGARAIEWFRREKLRDGEAAPTLEDLRTIVARMAAPAGQRGGACPGGVPATDFEGPWSLTSRPRRRRSPSPVPGPPS